MCDTCFALQAYHGLCVHDVVSLYSGFLI